MSSRDTSVSNLIPLSFILTDSTPDSMAGPGSRESADQAQLRPGSPHLGALAERPPSRSGPASAEPIHHPPAWPLLQIDPTRQAAPLPDETHLEVRSLLGLDRGHETDNPHRHYGVRRERNEWKVRIVRREITITKGFSITRYGDKGAEALVAEHVICRLASSVKSAKQVGMLLQGIQRLPGALQVEPLISLFHGISDLKLSGENLRAVLGAWLYVAKQRRRDHRSLAHFAWTEGPQMPSGLSNGAISAWQSRVLGNFAQNSVVGQLEPEKVWYQRELATNPSGILAERSEILDAQMDEMKRRPPQ